MDKKKKRFRETKIGIFLKEKAPAILDKIGDVLPDKGVLGVVKNLIDNDKDLSPQDKELALKELDFDLAEMDAVTKRWEADMLSDSWLSKNARPMVLLACVLMLFVFIILDSCNIKFEIKESWISLYEVLLTSTVLAYYGGRVVEKYHNRKLK